MVVEGKGRILEYIHEGDPAVVHYASLTAPQIVRCEVRVEGKLVDVVYAGAGGSHSWWLQNGIGLVPRPLENGQRLTVDVDGHAAFRIDI